MFSTISLELAISCKTIVKIQFFTRISWNIDSRWELIKQKSFHVKFYPKTKSIISLSRWFKMTLHFPINEPSRHYGRKYCFFLKIIMDFKEQKRDANHHQTHFWTSLSTQSWNFSSPFPVLGYHNLKRVFSTSRMTFLLQVLKFLGRGVGIQVRELIFVIWI